MAPLVLGRVESIHIAPVKASPMERRKEVVAEAGLGLVGDRYHANRGTYSKPGQPRRADRDVTLIEVEAVDDAARDYKLQAQAGDIRRNIVTRGVALNHLVGKEFTVGEARLRGVKLCEPCDHMAGLVGEPVAEESLVHRGGLRCQVVAGGKIREGDSISMAG